MSENFEQRLSEIFGDGQDSYDEKFQRHREFLKKHNRVRRN